MLPNQKHRFRIPEDVTYLNCAYLSPQLKSVTAAGVAAVQRKEQPWTITPPDFFETVETVRGLFGQMVDAAADDIAIIPSVSYGVGVAAANLPLRRGQNIVMLAEQFPSNVYPWREAAREKGAEIRVVNRPENGDWTAPLLAAIDAATAGVATPHCHWTDGSRVDLLAVRRRCDEVGAALVVDATQSLGAMPFSVKKVRPDFLVAAAYKWLLGPYSLAYLYVAPAHQNGRPLEFNWINRKDSENFAELVNYRDEYQAGARRFDVGEKSNFALMPMAAAALSQIAAWQVPQIYQSLAAITAQINERARALGLSVVPPEVRSGHLTGLRFPHGVPPRLVTELAREKIYLSVRGNAIRISPHLYNTLADVEKLFQVLSQNTP